jgi:hypothetical protein
MTPLQAVSAPPAPITAAAPAIQSRRATRLAWLLGSAGLSLTLTVQQFRDPDVWWHLALGRIITAHGIPSVEPFTFLAAPHAWVGQQWGYEVLLSRLVALGGPGMAMLVMGLAGSAALMLAALCVPRHERIPGWALAAAMLLGGLVAGQLLGVRGQVITVLGCAATLLVVTRWREGSTRAPWALVPMLAVWANLHAGFVVGLALPLLAAATMVVWRRVDPEAAPRARVHTLLLASAAAAVATLANPAGPGLYAYVGQTFLNPTLTQSITEWQSPDFHNMFLRLFEVEVAGLIALWVLSRRPDPLDVVLAMSAVAASLQAQRNVALFAVIATPQVARYAMAVVERWTSTHRARARRAPQPLPFWFTPLAATTVVFATLAVDVLPATRSATTADYEARTYPAAAVDYVATHLRGERLYSTYEWGGYLAYRFPEDRVVYIYGESAILGASRLNEYLQVHLLQPGWQDVLYRQGMRHAVVPAHSQETAAFQEIGWSALCYDRRSGAVVLSAPQSPPNSTSDLPPDVTTATAC